MHVERGGGRFVASVLLLAVAGNAALAQEHKEHRLIRHARGNSDRLERLFSRLFNPLITFAEEDHHYGGNYYNQH